MIKFFFIILGTCLGVCISYADPAKDIQLKYDLPSQKLHIEAEHPTDHMDKYFVRLVKVTADSKEPKSFTFVRQSSPVKFIADLDYAAQGGEHLDVELFVSEGGVSKASIDIPKPSPEVK